MKRTLLLRTAAPWIYLLPAAALACWPAAAAAAPPPEPPAAADVAFFEKEVLPILRANCLKCHGGGEKVRGGLQLTSRELVLKGGDSGPAVTPDKPAASRLLHAINWRDGLEMPPKGKLPAKDIATLTRWVEGGLAWTPGKAEPAAVVKHSEGGKVTPESRNYWAYKPVHRPDPPAVKDAAQVSNPIDAFLLAKLEAKGLTLAPPADRLALARRVYYDLTGLPPTPDEVDAFVKDPAPDAYEKLVDRLLASPHYGQKWGRHWLDVVRFAETNGYERDGPKPFAWRYRDYVIKSFNDDKPFDRFVREQLAGDEMPGYHPDAIIATGYYRLGLWDDEPADPLQARFDELDDIVATTSQAFLGMTMNCARCHDHKIDPIPQADYYRLVAFVQDVPRFSYSEDTRSAPGVTDLAPPNARAAYEKELAQRDARLEELRLAMRKIENAAIPKMSAEDQRTTEGPGRTALLRRKLKDFLTKEEAGEYDKLKKERIALETKPKPTRELALSVNHCPADPGPTHVLIRGNPHASGVEVHPAFPTVLGGALPTLPKGGPTSGRRTALANWIASADNPLTARVFVNRLWEHHFGRGIVATPNDFGKFGTGPTHPELLDWLASEFVAGGWRVKRMQRLIMLSSAYRMSARASEAGLKADPANALFWRFNMRRLTAEEVRDSILAVSGKLNLKAGGPSVYPPIPKEVLAGQSMPGSGWNTSSPEEASRRSVYVHVKRSLLVPILAVHDQADTDNSCPVRFTTTVPTQALGMLNGAFVNEQAAALAERLRREAPGNLAGQVRLAIRLTTGRVPGGDEVDRDVQFVRGLSAKGVAEPLQKYCLMALNTNEFVYLD
jgi:mono/diheme cytochrome c family protein